MNHIPSHSNTISIQQISPTTLQISVYGIPLHQNQLSQFVDTLLKFIPDDNTISQYTVQIQPFETTINIQCLYERDVDNILLQKSMYEKKLLKFLATTSETQSKNTSSYIENIPDKSWYHLKELLAHISKRFSNISFFELAEEGLRIFLATDNEFKKIRPFTFLARLILSHFSLRKKWSTHTPETQESVLKTRLWRSMLVFPFGRQRVLSLAISLRDLSAREKFELHHILSGCRRIISSIQAVPHSFYFYKHSKDNSWNFYVELEKKSDTDFTKNELQLLRSHIEQELIASIELVANRIDIPYNEEEILRTIHTLSQELKTKDAIPQVLIQFQRQQLSTIQFNVYVLRVVREDEIPHEAFGSQATSIGIVQLKLQRQEIVGHIKKKHVKLLQLFEAQCIKKNVMRSDYSINFIKAREHVLYAIKLHFGPIRDVNGGFLAEQRTFFQNLKQMLPIVLDDREEQFLEQLVRSLKPSIGKVLPEKTHILQLASLLFTLQREHSKNHSDDMLSKTNDDVLFIVVKRPQNMAEDELLQVFVLFSLEEHEVLYSFVTHEETSYACFAFLRRSPDLQKLILQWVTSIVSDCTLRLKRQQGIRISLPRPTKILDPRIGTDRTSGAVIKMLYEGLMRLNPEGKPELALAESYTLSPDKKQYTFTLRPSYWSNGDPLVAHDFEYAWKKIVDPKLQTLFYHLFLPIKNAHDVKDGKKPLDDLGVKAIDNKTLFVELEHPYPYFPELLSHWMYSPLCRSTDLVHPGWACFGAEQHVSNGPFRLTKWKQDKEIEAVKNEWYWNKQTVLLERVHMKIIEDPKLAWKLFLKGDLDWIGEPLSQLPTFVTKSPPPSVAYHQTNGVQWFALNTATKIFSNKKIRQAFSFAIDRKKIVDSCRFGKERISHSILPAQLSVLDANDSLSYNPEKALQLFHEGLLELGMQKNDLALRMLAYNAEFLVLISQQVIYDWEKLFGIRVQLEIVDWYIFFDSLPKSKYDIISIVWYSWFNHPSYTLEALAQEEGNMNVAKWKNTQFQELVQKIAHSTSKMETQAEIYQAEKLLIEEMPVIPVFEYFSQYAKNKAIENIFISPLGNVDFRWAHVTI